jgi:hypothetical protein
MASARPLADLATAHLASKRAALVTASVARKAVAPATGSKGPLRIVRVTANPAAKPTVLAMAISPGMAHAPMVAAAVKALVMVPAPRVPREKVAHVLSALPATALARKANPVGPIPKAKHA